MKYKVITGLLREDQENYPGIPLFESALNNAVKEYYMPILTTFRVTPVATNIMYTVIAELVDTPGFIGGQQP